MHRGYIKLWRKIKEWEWYHDSQMVHLFLHLLISANRLDGEWQGIQVKRGQFITGRNSLAKDTGISPQSLRTCIKRLKSTNELTTQSTSKFSIFTLLKYDEYQSDIEKSTIQSTNKSTNNQPAINQQSTTNKTYKKYKNEKNTSEFLKNYPQPTNGEVTVLEDGTSAQFRHGSGWVNMVTNEPIKDLFKS